MLDFDLDLLKSVQTNAPRYTSYPTADRFNASVTAEVLQQQLVSSLADAPTDQVSLYIHIPFCNTLCLFCACNKIITNKRQNIKDYLEYLQREISLYNEIVGRRLKVVQLHFGGGSPSWLALDEVKQIMQVIEDYFDLSEACEIAMEIDPRHTTADFIYGLKQCGFNRISLGVQDFNHAVQLAVNRVQSYEATKTVIDAAKECSFKSTNIDLIYGLPKQSKESFSDTLAQIISLLPDRIALFNYAHLPAHFMPQTRINEADLPSAQTKLDILAMSIEELTQAGYVFIGMDHFALNDDELVLSMRNGTMQRNFQGYASFANTNMVAFGVSAIGFLGSSYYQNYKDLGNYYKSIDEGVLPVCRGVILSADDSIRKAVISEIMCKFSLNYAQIGSMFSLDFNSYFSSEIEQLQSLSNLGIINIDSKGFIVTNSGRFLLRNIAMVFDKYLHNALNFSQYSKIV